jgi:hypothetical protein
MKQDDICSTNLSEPSRTRLIEEIATLIREDALTPEARAAGLTLIGWLARRMPQDVIEHQPGMRD